LILARSLEHTALAPLSRPVAGTIGNTLVVTLPGSVKAVKENLDILFLNGLIDHAVDLIRGGSGKRVHTSLAASALNSHEEHRPTQPRVVLSRNPSLPGLFILSSSPTNESFKESYVYSIGKTKSFSVSADHLREGHRHYSGKSESIGYRQAICKSDIGSSTVLSEVLDSGRRFNERLRLGGKRVCTRRCAELSNKQCRWLCNPQYGSRQEAWHSVGLM
jgi:hypothetical protein